MTTTIHDLPNEILCDILTIAHDAQPGVRTSIRLSSVCDWWNAVSHSLQALWSEVHITSYDADILEQVFTRAKDSFINVEIIFREPTPKGATFGLWRSVILLAAEMGRCRRLSVTAPGSVFKVLRDVFGHCGVDAPYVWSIELRRVDEGLPADANEECTTPRINFDPDLLEQISLDAVSYQPSLGDLGSLKALFVKNTHASWLHDSLPLVNELEVLCLARSTVPWGRFFSCPELQHLVLEDQDSVSLLDAYWDTPALTHLTLVRPTASFWESLMFVLGMSPQPLGLAKVKKLSLVECDGRTMAQSADMGTFLDALPGLETIESVKTALKPVMEVLDVDSTALPNLKQVVIDGSETKWRDTVV